MLGLKEGGIRRWRQSARQKEERGIWEWGDDGGSLTLGGECGGFVQAQGMQDTAVGIKWEEGNEAEARQQPGVHADWSGGRLERCRQGVGAALRQASLAEQCVQSLVRRSLRDVTPSATTSNV